MKVSLKAILLALGGIFLAYQSFGLVNQLFAIKPANLGVGGEIVIALLLNLFVTGTFALPGFAFATSRVLPDGYFTIKNPKRLLRWYKLLGVAHFRQFLLRTFWANPKNQKRYFDGTKAGFANLSFQSKQSEFGHLLPLIIIEIIAVAALIEGYFYVFGVATALNIIGNFYPIPLQRMHRYRLARLEKR
jgi:hypothetical protein